MDKLKKQFMQATGIVLGKDPKEAEYKEWLATKDKENEFYYKFINEITSNFNCGKVSEIGKSPLDSIAYLDNSIEIVTPYLKEQFINSKNNIVEGNFLVFNGWPIIEEKNSVEAKIYNADRYITQNPYDIGDINSWADLHNSNKYNITVGVYGRYYDMDKCKKLEALKYLREKLEGNFTSEYAQIEDMYFYAISSHAKTKVLIKK